MASGYPGRDLQASFGLGAGSAVHVSYHQRPDGVGGLIKRSLSELDRQHQMQQALLRSVKQRIDCSSSSSFGFGFQNPNPLPVLVRTELEKKSAMQNQLQELERQLLDDDDDDKDTDIASVTASAVTTSEWSDAMHQLVSPPTATAAVQNALSPSPTTSTSSSSSSSTSCPPNSRRVLLDTAAAISDGNYDAAAMNLTVLKRSANPRGDPDQRLTAMMLSALVMRTSTGHPSIELCSLEHQTATHMLYDVSPCFRISLMAANLAIIDATRGCSKIHVVDFDIGQGGQCFALIYAVAERSRQIPSLQPPSLKITAVSDPTFPFSSLAATNNLNLVGHKIAKLSARLGLNVKFNIVNRKSSELDRTALGCEEGEALAVNFSFVLSRIADESVSPANPRDEMLRRVKSLEPKVVTVVEQEVNFNTAPFQARFSEACSYYGSLLDSIDSMVARDSVDRARVEASLGRKAANAVANESADRIERPEVFGKWRARMGMAGLQQVAFGPAVSEPVRTRFVSLGLDQRFTLKEEEGGIGLGWMGRVLTISSGWR